MNTPTPTPRTAVLKATGMRRRYARCFETELNAATGERDQLRAEVERLNALGSWAHTCIHHTDEERKAWVACPCCATARAERAEAALADERARLDSGQILLAVAGERVWHCGVDLRAAIDAGIKEGAK